MEVIVGGASGAKGSPQPGDQSGKEVRLQTFKTVSAFAHGWMSGYSAYRCTSSAMGSNMARIMAIACNNDNIGYLNQVPQRMEIFQYGENATEPCRCDCSSLVGYCIAAASGNSSIGTNLDNLGSLMVSSGLFVPFGQVSQYSDTNPPCAGDVLIGPSKEHTEMVVSGGIASGYIVGGSNTNFKPRTSAPSPSEPNYALYYSTSYCEDANSSYAWSRFSEILGALCKLSRSTGRHWYNNSSDGYKRGTYPAPGAVMCFTNTFNSGDPGFVCIVEGGTDNEVFVSYKNNSGTFVYTSIKKHDGSWDLDFNKDGSYEYFFQGFIYNPNVQVGVTTKSKLTEFIQMAKNHISDGREFTKKYSKLNPDTNPWSAAYVMAVATAVGDILGKVIPNTNSCSSIGSMGSEGGMGNWLNGPLNNGNPYPKVGDLALFRLNALPGSSRYNADKVGIVTNVSGNSSNATKGASKANNTSVGFTYIMGDSSGRTESKTSTSTASTLVGIFRPNWGNVDSLSESAGSGLSGYYAQSASAEDALIKDYKYIDAYTDPTQPSISPNGIMLCAVNYNGMIGSVYTIFSNMLAQNSFISGAFSPAISEMDFTMLDPEVAASVDGLTGSIEMGNGKCYLNSTNKAIYKYLYMLFNSNGAGAVGFMANMWAESGFNTAALNKGSGASGLCQWLGGRKTGMTEHCLQHGGYWANNLSGQLEWLSVELTGSYYHGTLVACSSCPWNLMGAKQAADYVCRHFEVPVVNNEPKMAAVSQTRQQYAERLWQLFFGGALAVQ